MTNYKKQFEEIYTANIKRDGAKELLAYLDSTDFFRAPASTRFHSNFAGGLVEHTVKVYMRFKEMLEMEHDEKWVNDNIESITIIALLHDICKVNCYKTEMRNTKVDGEWVQKPFYSFEDPLPYGHGEKSVYVISAYMKLTREEAMAINWHMGAFDERNANGKFTVSNAFQMYPIAAIFFAADLLTTYLDEKILKN